VTCPKPDTTQGDICCGLAVWVALYAAVSKRVRTSVRCACVCVRLSDGCARIVTVAVKRQLGVRLDPDVVRWLRHRAADKDVTLGAVVEALAREKMVDEPTTVRFEGTRNG
jgi:hypothetical protein